MANQSSSDEKTTKYVSGELLSAATSGAIDPDQLLDTCHRIKESIKQLDNGIGLTRLRLISLTYLVAPTTATIPSHRSAGTRLNPIAGNLHQGDSLRCFDDLVDLCRLSQTLVGQLDTLNQKLHHQSPNSVCASSISYQIAVQQLIFFTSQWYDNLAPKLNDIFKLADKVDLNLLRQTSDSQAPISDIEALNSTEIRVRNSLARLRQSMSENERLIVAIANNVELARETIESIYGSLRITRIGLGGSKRNLVDSIDIARSSQRTRLICAVLIFVVLSFFILLIYKLLT